jgi:hypothetical protein
MSATARRRLASAPRPDSGRTTIGHASLLACAGGRLGRGVPMSRAAGVARRVATLALADADAAVCSDVPGAVAAALGWVVRPTLLRATQGGLQAVLLQTGERFTVLIDPRPAPGPQEAHSPALIRQLRLAHEIGHALFYDAGRPPRRPCPPDPAEEKFCDVFAAALTATRPGAAEALRALLPSHAKTA